MKSVERDPRHFVKKAANIKEAVCVGRYMGVSIEKVLINAPIVGGDEVESKEGDFTLVKVLYTNNWKHRISTRANAVKMIDTDGIQHSCRTRLYPYQMNSRVKLPENRYVPFNFVSPEETLEGEAKTRGWLWFPTLSSGIYPKRFLFQLYICEPGEVCTPRVDEETLEIVFMFQLTQLLPETNAFLTLEVESPTQ